MTSILAQSLTRNYGNQVAVDQLSFEINQGTVLGLLGPNGAGKSTTMRMLSGYLRPSSGTALINGHDVCLEPTRVHQQMGYLPEGAPLYSDMTVSEFLSFVAAARGLQGKERCLAVGRVMEHLDLEDVTQQVIGTLSKGFGRRVGLAQAIIHDPPILLLDEPTDGLDPIQKQQVRRLIQEMASNRIIVISTHILAEVELLCQRLMMIAGGKLLVDGSPEEVRRRSRYLGALTLSVDEPQRLASHLSDLAEVKHVEIRGGRVTAFPSGEGNLRLAVDQLINHENWPVHELHLESGRLEDVFIDVVAGVDG